MKLLSVRASLPGAGFALLCVFSTVVQCDVGVMAPSGQVLDEATVIGPQSWFLSSAGCFVGRARNLVVTPLGGRNSYGGEALDTKGGSELCSWLSMMERVHNGLRNAWEAAHQRRRQEVSRWNLFRRFKLWSMSFPDLEVEVKTRYLDLWHKDRFGHAMPWIMSHFSYKCPQGEKGMGLFDHLCTAMFANPQAPGLPQAVYMLLHPRPGYNQPADVKASNWQFLQGAAAGLRGSGGRKGHDEGNLWLWAADLYGRARSFMTIQGKIDDFWMNGGFCYYGSLLRVDWRLFSETVCERLHREANSGVLSAFKASRIDSTRMHVTGTEFFNYEHPVLWAWLGEGILDVNVGSGLLRLDIDTNPENQPNFERSKTVAQNTRAAGLLVGGVTSLFRAYQNSQGGRHAGERRHKHRSSKFDRP